MLHLLPNFIGFFLFPLSNIIIFVLFVFISVSHYYDIYIHKKLLLFTIKMSQKYVFKDITKYNRLNTFKITAKKFAA